MIKKMVSLVIVISIMVLCFSGCTFKSEPLFGVVLITGPSGEIILDSEVFVSKKNATAADAVIEGCAEFRIPYTFENGMFDNFEGIASTMDEGWLLYYEGELSDVGASSVKLTDNFDVEFRYVNYDESFTLE